MWPCLVQEAVLNKDSQIFLVVDKEKYSMVQDRNASVIWWGVMSPPALWGHQGPARSLFPGFEPSMVRQLLVFIAAQMWWGVYFNTVRLKQGSKRFALPPLIMRSSNM